MQNMKMSPFWKTPNYVNGEKVFVRRLGSSYEGMEFKAIVRGVYACDVNGNPDCYILELVDKIPCDIKSLKDEYVNSFSFHVFPRGCVDSQSDITLKDSRLITNENKEIK